MKKIFIVLIVGVLVGMWLKNFVSSGQLDKYLDTHPNDSVNAPVEYYWGMLLQLCNHEQSAKYRLARVMAKYPKTDYAPRAMFDYVDLLDTEGDRNGVLEQGQKFLEQYPEHSQAEIIRKKISIIEHGF
jgi:TolA-binding protein